MEIFKNISMRAAGIGMAAMLAFAIIFVCVGGHGGTAPLVLFAGAFFVLISGIGFLAAALRTSLKITLYSYKNIAFIGGIIFNSILLISLLGSYYSCIRNGGFTLESFYREVIEFPREFSMYALAAIITVSLAVAVSNIELIRRERFSKNNVLSIVLGGFYTVGIVAVFFISDLITKYIFTHDSVSPVIVTLHSIVPMFFMLMMCYLECVFIGSMIMGWVVTRKKPAFDKDYIIILGCSIDKKGGLLPLLRGRVNAAVRFAWDQEIATGKQAKYVPSGGQGANEIMSEGSAMELYLKTRGAEDDEVFPERKSVNTYENMKFSKQIIDEIDPDATIAFATTNYHVLRSGILAREAGFDAEGISGDTKWYFWPNGFIREFFGILALKKKAHIMVTIFIAALSVALGMVGYFGHLI